MTSQCKKSQFLSRVSFLEQVFILLETLYMAFDKIAKARKVFKVETVGEWRSIRLAIMPPSWRASPAIVCTR